MKNSDVTRREFMEAAVVTGGALVGEQLMPGAISLAAAQSPAAPAPLDVVLSVNGTQHPLTLDPRTTLLDALREHLHLTGSEERLWPRAVRGLHRSHGRQAGEIVPRRSPPLVEGREVTTIEGSAPKAKSSTLCKPPFIERDAFQCGYCTSGQIMAGVACIQRGSCRLRQRRSVNG